MPSTAVCRGQMILPARIGGREPGRAPAEEPPAAPTITPVEEERAEIAEILAAGPLVLRTLGLEDVPALHAAVLANLDHLRPFMPWIASEPVPLEERLALVERWSELRRLGREWHFGLFLEGDLAGAAGLRSRGAVREIGYWVHRGYTRRGVATLSSFLLTDAAFSSPAVEAVEIWHDRANTASGAIPPRLGYRKVAERPANPLTRSAGDEGIDCIWQVTRAEWLSNRPPEPELHPPR